MSNNDSILATAINNLAQSRAAATAHLSERERYFRRAGTGAGLSAASLYLMGSGIANNEIGCCLCMPFLVYGVWSLAIGARRSQGPRDLYTAGMAVPATAVGAAGLLLLPSVGLLTAVWLFCLVGGLTMLTLSLRGISSRGLTEVRAQQAHGRARDATPAETGAQLDEDAARPRRQFQD